MLKNRVVLVTGASRGIGAATAKVLTENGAAVAVNYRENEAAARAVIQGIISAAAGLSRSAATCATPPT